MSRPTDIRDGDLVRATAEGIWRISDIYTRVIDFGDGKGFWVLPDAASVEVVEPKGYPWYGDDLRRGDCDRLPVGTILRAATGAVFVKSPFQGKWLKNGEQQYVTEDQILVTDAQIVWLPEDAKRESR